MILFTLKDFFSIFSESTLNHFSEKSKSLHWPKNIQNISFSGKLSFCIAQQCTTVIRRDGKDRLATGWQVKPKKSVLCGAVWRRHNYKLHLKETKKQTGLTGPSGAAARDARSRLLQHIQMCSTLSASNTQHNSQPCYHAGRHMHSILPNHSSSTGINIQNTYMQTHHV